MRIPNVVTSFSQSLSKYWFSFCFPTSLQVLQSYLLSHWFHESIKMSAAKVENFCLHKCMVSTTDDYSHNDMYCLGFPGLKRPGQNQWHKINACLGFFYNAVWWQTWIPERSMKGSSCVYGPGFTNQTMNQSLTYNLLIHYQAKISGKAKVKAHHETKEGEKRSNALCWQHFSVFCKQKSYVSWNFIGIVVKMTDKKIL